MIFFILFLLFVSIFKIYLEIVKYRYIENEMFKQPVILDSKSYKDSANIAIYNSKYAIVELIYSFCISLFWLLFGFKIITFNGDSSLLEIVTINLFLIIGLVLNLPFDIFEKFVKDKKFGFSVITSKIFVTDFIKSTILSIIISSIAVLILISCIKLFGEFWWLYAAITIFILSLFLNLIYPTVIEPMFNKVKPLEDAQLKEEIFNLLDKVGFKSDGIFVVDASKRDSRLNAYFTGFGNSKRVVLYDTLLNKLSQKEIIAVLGHELGHFKHNDIIKNIFLSAILIFLSLFVLSHIPTYFYDSLNLSSYKISSTILIFIVFAPSIFMFIRPLMAFFSKKCEFKADDFSAKITDKKDMISALKKLSLENKSFPKTHPLYAFFYYSHPTVFDRIEKLENESI